MRRFFYGYVSIAQNKGVSHLRRPRVALCRIDMA